MKRLPTLVLGATLAVGAVGPAAGAIPDGLELEQVEPGVHRVDSDRIRELAYSVEVPAPDSPEARAGFVTGLVIPAGVRRGIASDGERVWVEMPDGIIELGTAGALWTPRRSTAQLRSFDVGPGGTLYRPKGALVLDDAAWKQIEPRVRGFTMWRYSHLLLAPDGATWVASKHGVGEDRRIRLARRDADGWSRVPPPPDPPSWRFRPSGKGSAKSRPPRVTAMGLTDDGTLYVLRGLRDVQRLDPAGWESLPRPGGIQTGLLVGADGTIWAEERVRSQRIGVPTRVGTTRRLGPGDETWSEHDLGPRHPFLDATAVGADGALWFVPGDREIEAGECDGVARFDGSSTRRYLRGLCIYSIAAAPGGDIWLRAGSWDGRLADPRAIGPIGVYVIDGSAAAG